MDVANEIMCASDLISSLNKKVVMASEASFGDWQKPFGLSFFL